MVGTQPISVGRSDAIKPASASAARKRFGRIKSGGEWISSVELENEVMSHPDVIEAAVIAKPDERWAERPLCCVVVRDGASTTAADIVEHLRGRVAKWWLPDEFAFLAEIPKTSVGKFDKKVLRTSLSDGTLEGRAPVS